MTASAPGIAQDRAKAQARVAWLGDVQRFLLRSDSSVEVFEDDRPREASVVDRRLYPVVVFSGYMGRVFVYRMITSAETLQAAKLLGFRGARFTDRGPDGSWIFDLTGPSIPACDTHHRICR